jgi:CheY-like chemotaxis protein
LTAEDVAEDCFLASEAFSERGANAAFRCVLDGLELMNHLAERSRSNATEPPTLISLDLNMPRKDGRDALIEIKAEPATMILIC